MDNPQTQTDYFFTPPVNIDGAFDVVQAIIDLAVLEPLNVVETLNSVDCNGDGGLYPDNVNVASGEFRARYGFYRWSFDNGTLTPPGDSPTTRTAQFSVSFTPASSSAVSTVRSHADAIMIEVDPTVVVNHV
jgi:hypothetical protein